MGIRGLAVVGVLCCVAAGSWLFIGGQGWHTTTPPQDCSAVDGDTVKCSGQNLRLLGDGSPNVRGIDTPEMNGKCDYEKDLARKAKARTAELLQTPGLTIEDSGVKGSWGRPLVKLRLPDGRTVGAVLMAEGLAKEWLPGHKIDWCG